MLFENQHINNKNTHTYTQIFFPSIKKCRNQPTKHLNNTYTTNGPEEQQQQYRLLVHLKTWTKLIVPFLQTPNLTNSSKLMITAKTNKKDHQNKKEGSKKFPPLTLVRLFSYTQLLLFFRFKKCCTRTLGGAKGEEIRNEKNKQKARWRSRLLPVLHALFFTLFFFVYL